MKIDNLRNDFGYMVRRICISYLFVAIFLGATVTEFDYNKVVVHNTVKRYFELRYKSLSKLEILDEYLDIVYNDPNELSEIDILEILINYRKSQLIDLRMKNYKYDLEYTAIEILGDMARVELIENHTVEFNCIAGNKSIMEGLRHTIDLKLNPSGWIIYKDSYRDDIKDQFEYYKSREDERLNIEHFKNRYSKEFAKDKKLKIKVQKAPRIERVDNKDIEGRFKKGIYNREKASEYGQDYGLKMNSNYMNYENDGGDCTNFTSQCLRAGGINMDYEGEYQWYWQSDYFRTPSWTSAKAFRIYALNNNGSPVQLGLKAYETVFEEIDLGDIVQYTEATHSMIVTGCIYDSEKSVDQWKEKIDVLISQHSGKEGGRLVNYPLSSKPETKGRFYLKICCYYY